MLGFWMRVLFLVKVGYLLLVDFVCLFVCLLAYNCLK
jgi:hypothetical protein